MHLKPLPIVIMIICLSPHDIYIIFLFYKLLNVILYLTITTIIRKDTSKIQRIFIFAIFV